MSPSRTLVVLQIAVALGIVVLLGSIYLLRLSASSAFQDEIHLRSTRVLADAALKDQLDEETGIRGFDVSHDAVFLQPYLDARPQLRSDIDALAKSLVEDGIDDSTVLRAAELNHTWEASVAQPSIAHHDGPQVLKLGKAIVDEYRAQITATQAALDARQAEIDADRRSSLDRIGFFSAFAIVVLAAVALLFLRRQQALEQRLAGERVRAEESRLRARELRAAYEAEKRIADSLQDAIAQRPLPNHPTLRFSATYVPATDEARVGGDWYDAIELPHNRVLFAIGDVTGHGLDAAVTMSRARQALISSALFDSEPAMVLARVNDDLVGQNAPMVTAVAGFADAKTFEFVYASAGHPPPVLLEPNRAPRLLDFGGVPLGVVAGASYTMHRIQSVPGAMLVLYTDGAVEHTRDVIEGETILLASIALCGETPCDDAASVIHENIFHGHPAGDDVAILTIGFGQGRSASLRISSDDAQTSTTSRIERDVTTDVAGPGSGPSAAHTRNPRARRGASSPGERRLRRAS